MKNKIIFLVVLFFAFGFGSKIDAAIINSASCNQSDVQMSINNASDGDVISIPAGNCTWTSDVTLSGKGISLLGSGKSTTIIINNGGRLNITPDATHGITIKNIGWSVGTSPKNRTLNIVGNITDKPVIITGCDFDGAWSGGVWRLGTAIYINGNYGLIHNNTFGEGGKETIHVGGNDTTAWTTDTTPGTASATYIEDNIFANNEPSSVSAHHVVMGIGAGAKYVVRHNEIHNANIDAHGYCGNPRPYTGTRWVEIYDNDIRIDQGFSNTNIINIRGGSGVIFNNTITNNGRLNRGIQLSEYRVDEDYCQNIEGSCSCCCNTGGNGGEGWPCKYQIGRGKNNTSEPLYIWSNIFSGSPVGILKIGPIELSGDCDAVCGKTQLMTDYVQNQDNYTAGHGSAPDYYDDGRKLPGYTSYTYPHPLRNESPAPTCSDNIQNQNETGIDCGGPCSACVVPTYQCNDGIDNDSDGLTDYPNDPGCSSATDNDEYNAPLSDTTSPSIPTNLTATTISTSQINLSWTASTDNVGVTGYNIYRCAGTSCTPTTEIATSAISSYSNTGLSANTTYRYRVRAYDNAGNISSYSTIVTAQTSNSDTTPPTVSSPSPSGTLSSGTTSATLSVTTNETSVCKYSTTANTAYTSMTNTMSASSNTHTAVVNNLTNGTTYNYYVKCRDTAGNTTTSDTTIGFNVATSNPVPDTQAPTGGTILINNGSDTTNSVSVVLTLSANDNVGVTQMRFSDTDLTYSEWENYNTTKNWSLSSGDGTKTIYVKYRDLAGNVSSSANDSITYTTSTTPPASGGGGSSGGGSSSSGSGSSSGGGSVVGVSGGSVSYSNQTNSTPTNVSTPTETHQQTSSNVIFTQNLSFGSENTMVKKLQEFLAKDKTIYPEGITSGFYGNMTLKAIQRFQLKYNIVTSGTPETTGYGSVGPKTRLKLNEVYGGTSVTSSVSNTSNLTTEQANSIINLLVSFGADTTVVDMVRSILIR